MHSMTTQLYLFTPDQYAMNHLFLIIDTMIDHNTRTYLSTFVMHLMNYYVHILMIIVGRMDSQVWIRRAMMGTVRPVYEAP